ncbi:MAG: two-component system, NtrC family, response regulator AtoC [Desulfovibrionales bacterium]|nr:two-component system, NtrC family, response regulator AtoC [Desulfovibrionales bacterium]
MPKRILVVDDETAFRTMLAEALAEKGYKVDEAATAEEGVEMIRPGRYDLVLHDMQLPGMSGIEAIPLLRERDPLVDVIVMTGHSTRDSALKAMQQGAYDYFTKPFSLKEMEIVIRRVMEKRRLQLEVDNLKQAIQGQGLGRRIIGDSEAMRQVKRMVQRVATLETGVLITGETGTGKELIADTIHALSRRAEKPFIKLNCAAIPESLLESELFGHEKGAFTGASSVKRGKFELAEGGSILLDEIGDMPLHLQPKLLRAVEQKQVERVGGAKPVSFDVRIIAATNQDLHQRVADGEFRSDLYYRLNVASIELPPLRERKDDIPLLAGLFLRQINLRLGTDLASVSSQAMDLLFNYDWPGNVRQFANALERAAIFCEGPSVAFADIERAFRKGPPSSAPVVPAAPQDLPNVPLKQAVNDYEKALIRSALERTAGVQTEAAALLGISPKNLWNKLKKHGLDSAAF